MSRLKSLSLLCLIVATLSGCASPQSTVAEKFGKTFYLDGAGNWGYGAAEVPDGLREAGYRGNVEVYIWTTSLVPLIDQLNIPAARGRAQALADRIVQYQKKYPENTINLIALSAGTGVTIWAIEDLPPTVKINSVVLLGSSLSHDYDVRKALGNMTGKIYVYHSPHDQVLQGVTIIGTIDGKRGVESAGLVGLTPPRGMTDRIVNIPWSRRYISYGWAGGHTDSTAKAFIRDVVAPNLLGRSKAATGHAAWPSRESEPRYTAILVGSP